MNAARVSWAAVALSAAVATAFALDAHGHASRTSFRAPPEFAGTRWFAVPDAGAALRLIHSAGVRGRRVVVLTGRWSKPHSIITGPAAALASLEGARDPARESADALFTLAHVGMARALDVVMPSAVLARRLAEVAESKDLVRHRSGFALPFDALERRFWTPDAFEPPDEPAVIIAEPSFFDGTTPTDMARWLADRRVRFDLAIVALDDPAATDPQRLAARSAAILAGAQLAEVVP